MPSNQEERMHSLYEEHFEKLIHYAKATLGNNMYAVEEVVQDTFYTAMSKPEEFLNHPEPGAYLMTILKFKLCEYSRTKKREVKFFVSLGTADISKLAAPSNPYPISVDGIMKTIWESLTPKEQTIFHLRYILGRSHLEIAEKLGISVWTSQKRTERLRKKLEEILPDE